MTDTMRAIVLNAPGPPDVLTIRELPVPTPGQQVDVDGPVPMTGCNNKPGVTSDEGGGDEWPALRQRVRGWLAARRLAGSSEPQASEAAADKICSVLVPTTPRR